MTYVGLYLVEDPGAEIGRVVRALTANTVLLTLLISLLTTTYGPPSNRGPKDHVKIRISHRGSKAQYKGIPGTMFCRILVFMWSLVFGAPK